VPKQFYDQNSGETQLFSW